MRTQCHEEAGPLVFGGEQFHVCHSLLVTAVTTVTPFHCSVKFARVHVRSGLRFTVFVYPF